MNYNELLEFQKFRDFLPTKNAINIFNLVGNDNIGGCMKIVIDASPERLTNIALYDGMGNQMYPPHFIENDKLVSYIAGIADESEINEIVLCGPQVYTTKIAENLQKHFTTVNFTLLK